MAPFHLEGHGATHRQMHNAYGTDTAWATAEGLALGRRPERGQLVISRAHPPATSATPWSGPARPFSTWSTCG